MKVKFFLTLLFISILIASCDRKPDLAYLDACAHPDALKEVKYYVKHKISDTEGLLIAAEKNTNKKIVKELLKSKNIEEYEKLEALWISMGNKNIEVFKMLLKETKGANSSMNNGKTILMEACEEGNVDIVNLLIKAGADVNFEQDNEMTPLLYACENEDIKIINMLLTAKADVNAQNIIGVTALLFASRNLDKNVIDALLTAGADVNLSDSVGYTALMAACERNNLEVVKTLIEAKADVNAHDENGKTALMFACQRGDKDIVDILLTAGADVKAKTANGITALVQTYTTNNSSIKDMLIKAGANIKEVFEYCGIKMIPIPGKNIEMLSTEVTQKLYKFIMGNNPSKFKGDNNPVEYVNWYDAVEFCNALSQKLGFPSVYTIDRGNVSQDASADGFRLPSEAEWEYAAKGGVNYTYAGSNSIDEVAWYWNNSSNKPHPVAQKKANGYGLYDMSGNVWEWCWDVYYNDDNYYRSIRGGCYQDDADRCKVSGGDWDNSYARNRYDFFGFRLVRTVK